MTPQQTALTRIDTRRGTGGMMLTIATEAFLFVMFFFAYFYAAKGGWRWLDEKPPKLLLAFVMLAILLSSSLVIWWGEQQVKKQRYVLGRIAIVITLIMGFVFLAVQTFEYRDHLKELTPQSDVYGSISYTITTFHAAHVVVGLIVLFYVLILPRYEPVTAPPHRPYHNAAMYWHFVDFVWVFIVALLYVAPNLR